jgi:tRNA threonylcarbamoyladenosine biosynthesis protein TsaB
LIFPGCLQTGKKSFFEKGKAMNILAIETTGAEASVAVINEREEVSMEISDQKLNHLQNLMPMTDILLKKRGITIDDIDYIAVSEGPGSFTGIRIGVSSARALAQAMNRETIGVPTLKTFLYHVPEYRGIVCPIFDARRSQIYGGAYQWTDSCRDREIIPGAAYDLKEFLLLLGNAIQAPCDITFFGDGIASYQEQILKWQDVSLNDNIRVLFADNDLRLQKASSVARMALELYRAGEIGNLFDLKPVYMRKAEAERKLEEKG